jgi:MFS family permease
MNNADKPILLPYRWKILAIAMVAGFAGSYAQFQLPPLAYKLIPALHLSSSQYAALMSGPMIGAIFISILGGSLADRYGVKNVITVGLAFAVIGCTFRYAVTSFWPFLAMMILGGLASALLTSNLAKLFGAWFPPGQMGTVMGIYMISITLAMFLGTATTAFFPSEASAFIFSGVVCLLGLILWLMFAKDRPEGASAPAALPVIQYLGKAARSRGIWAAGICMFFVMSSIMIFTGFLPNVLHDVRSISPVEAGVYASLATLGGVFGSLLGPMICDRMGLMKLYLIIVGFLGAAATCWTWQLPAGPAIISGLIMAGFLQNAITPLMMSVPMLLPEIGPVYAGSAGGIISTLQVLGAVLVPTFIITPLAGANGRMLFGLAGLAFALTVIPVLFLPELGSRALNARASKASADTAQSVLS